MVHWCTLGCTVVAEWQRGRLDWLCMSVNRGQKNAMSLTSICMALLASIMLGDVGTGLEVLGYCNCTQAFKCPVECALAGD